MRNFCKAIESQCPIEKRLWLEFLLKKKMQRVPNVEILICDAQGEGALRSKKGLFFPLEGRG